MLLARIPWRERSTAVARLSKWKKQVLRDRAKARRTKLKGIQCLTLAPRLDTEQRQAVNFA